MKFGGAVRGTPKPRTSLESLERSARCIAVRSICERLAQNACATIVGLILFRQKIIATILRWRNPSLRLQRLRTPKMTLDTNAFANIEIVLRIRGTNLAPGLAFVFLELAFIAL